MRTVTIFVLVLALASSARAQTSGTSTPSAPAVALRGFGMVTGQEFAARTTFDATFGQAFEPFWGGGGQIVIRDGLYIEVAATRFHKVGQRAFLFDNQIFHLGIPLSVTDTPVEFSVGYRIRRSRRVIPYGGAGLGSYGYTEQSAFAQPGENVSTRHLGYLAVGGVETRVTRWVALGTDVQYTWVQGILGSGGISAQAHEDNLGGIAARVKIIIGR